MKLTLITFKDECEWTHCFLQQYANHCLRYVFSIVAYQVSRNIVLAPRSVMITISLHFISQSDNSILSKVTRINVLVTLCNDLHKHPVCNVQITLISSDLLRSVLLPVLTHSSF